MSKRVEWSWGRGFMFHWLEHPWMFAASIWWLRRLFREMISCINSTEAGERHRGSSISGWWSSWLQHLWGGRCLMLLCCVMDRFDEWDLSEFQLRRSEPVVKAAIPSVSGSSVNRDRITLSESYTDIFLLVKWLWLTTKTDHLLWL